MALLTVRAGHHYWYHRMRGAREMGCEPLRHGPTDLRWRVRWVEDDGRAELPDLIAKVLPAASGGDIVDTRRDAAPPQPGG
ncbi:hypothetical protein [Micromonospora avicenniae]|uniref:hypothetical protein n=1 Tax=Micromonospora avicenniae TaxID=1198245 RepID=UPI003330A65E